MKSKPYSTFEFYRDEYGGKLAALVYKRHAIKAKFEIDRRTFGRAEDARECMGDNLAMCECELLDAIYSYDKVPKGVSSVNNDGVSYTFGGRNSNDGMEDEAATIERVCRQYLTRPHNLLFGGANIHV